MHVLFFLFRYKKVKNTAYSTSCNAHILNLSFLLNKLPFIFSFSSSHHDHIKEKRLRIALVYTRLWTICITEMF